MSEARRSIADIERERRQALPNTPPKSERATIPNTDADDRDIVGGETTMDHARLDGVPMATIIQEADPDLVIDPKRMSSAMDFERFMNQVITVHLHDSGGPEDNDFAEVTVNGDYRCLVRGETSEIKRCHAEVLARAKHIRVIQKRVVNSDGSMGYEEKAVLKHTYPMSLIFDPAGRRGADWLKQLFKNPN